MEWTMGWVCVGPLPQKIQILQLVSVNYRCDGESRNNAESFACDIHARWKCMSIMEKLLTVSADVYFLAPDADLKEGT